MIDLGTLDLTGITWIHVLLIAAALAAIDTLGKIVLTLKDGTFDPAQVANFLETHVLQRIFPIVGLDFLAQAVLASGATLLGQALFAGAVGSLTAYLVETVKSVATNAAEPPAVVVPDVVAGSPG